MKNNKCKCGNNEFEIEELVNYYVEIIIRCTLCSKPYHLDLEDTTIMFNNNSALIDLCGEKIKEEDE